MLLPIKPEGGRYSRREQPCKCGVNPGSIKEGQKKVPIKIPRYYDNKEERAQNCNIYSDIEEQ